MEPAFKTKRLTVFRMDMVISETFYAERALFVAFPRHDGYPRVICTMLVTTTGLPLPYLDWISTDLSFQRQGYAVEMWRGVENLLGPLNADGASEAGDALCAKMEQSQPNET